MSRAASRLSLLGAVVLSAISGCGSESESKVGLRAETQDAIWGCVINAPSPGIDPVLNGDYEVFSALERQCRYAMSLFYTDHLRMGEPPELNDLGNAILETATDPSSENRTKLNAAAKAILKG